MPLENPDPESLFRRSSKTYYRASQLFPRRYRHDVGTLYAFLRTADDLVDAQPPQKETFLLFCQSYHEARDGKASGLPLVDNFVELSRRKQFDPAWTEDFLAAMESDLTKTHYDSLEELWTYTHGAAEVVGLFMAKLLDLPEESFPSAALLGRAMQYANFIRDLGEDWGLGRRYLPLQGLIPSLSPEVCKTSPQSFRQFVLFHAQIFSSTLQKARTGFHFLPPALNRAVQLSTAIYEETCRLIVKNPLWVWREKVRPNPIRVLWITWKIQFFRGEKP